MGALLKPLIVSLTFACLFGCSDRGPDHRWELHGSDATSLDGRSESSDSPDVSPEESVDGLSKVVDSSTVADTRDQRDTFPWPKKDVSGPCPTDPYSGSGRCYKPWQRSASVGKSAQYGFPSRGAEGPPKFPGTGSPCLIKHSYAHARRPRTPTTNYRVEYDRCGRVSRILKDGRQGEDAEKPDGKWDRIVAYYYDRRGRLRMHRTVLLPSANPTKYVYRYDRRNRLIAKKLKADDGSDYRRHEFEYDDSGNRVRRIARDSHGEILHSEQYVPGSECRIRTRRHFQPDAERPGRIMKYTYGQFGCVKELIVTSRDRPTRRYTNRFEFGPGGRIDKVNEENQVGSKQPTRSTTIFLYDSQGRLKRTQLRGTNLTHPTTRYFYDCEGK